MPQMYNLLQFGNMMSDSTRVGSYYQALKRAVHPGSIVVDIGAGTGIFSLFACQFGAARVYAIEPNDWISVGKGIAEANGLSDRIVFIKDYSTSVTLPEQADVIVSDLRGVHPVIPSLISSIADAR